MLNTRNFIKSLLVASVAPSILLSSAKDRTKWKATKQGLWIPNPAYANAPYEIAYCSHVDFVQNVAYPYRYDLNMNLVNPLILI